MEEKEIIDSLQNLCYDLEKIDKERIEAEKRSGLGFNIFTVLLKEDDEVRLHTRFLHNLLNPCGSHKQGSQFLELFFETLEHVPPLNPFNDPEVPIIKAASMQWKVDKEYNCDPYGTIDILLENNGFAVALENKIHAAEQPRQLQCYGDYLSARCSINSILLYLTLDGKKSETNGQHNYLRISYKSHIFEWLHKCIYAIRDVPSLRIVIEQYLALVEQITGQNKNYTHMTNEAELILRTYPSLISSRQQIKKALDSAVHDFLNNMAREVSAGIRDDGFEVDVRPDYPSFGSSLEGTLVIRHRQSSFLGGMPLNFCLQHWVEGESMVIGLEIKERLCEDHQKIVQEMNRILSSPEQTYSSNAKHKATKFWPVGWYDIEKPFHDQRISELLSCEADFIERLCQAIRENYAMFDNAYKEAKLNLSN